MPLITVITVIYNGEKYLEQTIQSVINQTYPNVEYIIIDGGSTDGTLDIIKKYEDYIDYWVSEKDKGIYDAMNKGVKISIGLFVAFLGSDDFYEKNALLFLIQPYILGDKSDIFYGDSRILLNDEFLYVRKAVPNKNKIIFGFILLHPDSITKLALYKYIGLFNTSFKLAADYEFFLRAYYHGYEFKKIDRVVVNFRLLGYSSNFKEVFRERIKLYRIYKLNIFFLIITCLQYVGHLVKYHFKLDDTNTLIRWYKILKNTISIP